MLAHPALSPEVSSQRPEDGLPFPQLLIRYISQSFWLCWLCLFVYFLIYFHFTLLASGLVNFVVVVVFNFLLWGRLPGQREDKKGSGDEWDLGAWCTLQEE